MVQGIAYVAPSTDWNFGSYDFTIDFWIFPTGTTDYHPVFITRKNYGEKFNLTFYLEHKQFGKTIEVSLIRDNGERKHIVTNASAELGKWQHMTVVRQNNYLNIYKDGVVIASADITGWTLDTSTGFTIGSDTASPIPHFLNGYIDNFRISRGIALPPGQDENCSKNQEIIDSIMTNLDVSTPEEIMPAIQAMKNQIFQLQDKIDSLLLQSTELQKQVNDLSDQINALTQENETLKNENAQLKEAFRLLQNSVDGMFVGIEGNFRQVFNNPLFTIPGSTSEEKLQNLLQAISNLEKGRKEGLYKNLGGK